MNTKGVEDEIYVHGEDAAYSRAIHDAEEAIKALITIPIPEERTAEMEQLMGIIKEYRTAPRLHTIGWLMCISDEFGDTRCPTCIKADELFDHIEGKAKAEEVQE